MAIEIRSTVEGDVPEIIRMMRDFAEFEKFLEYFRITENRLAAAMFGPSSFVDGLIAEIDGRSAGYAIFYPCFATFSGQAGLFLEDLYIEQSCRGRGVGEAMLRHLARAASERGFERIDFQVLDWNAPAIGFYKKHGAERHDDERHFKFAGEAFEKLARSEPST